MSLLLIKFAFCNLDPTNVTAPGALTFPLLVPDLAFFQFFFVGGIDFAFSPYFCGLGQFDRIIEMDEQPGLVQEIFKNFLKMVPIYPRFFSY